MNKRPRTVPLAKRPLRIKKRTVKDVKARRFLEEVNDKTVEELSAELVSAKKELFTLRFQNATNQLDNTSRIKEVRRNIARIQTVITQKGKAAQ